MQVQTSSAHTSGAGCQVAGVGAPGVRSQARENPDVTVSQSRPGNGSEKTESKDE